MADYPFMPSGLFPVEGNAPVITGGTTSDYVSLKNARMCWVVCHFANATTHNDATTIEQATDVAGTGTTPIVNAVPIWFGVVTSASSKLAAQTSAVSFTAPDATGDKILIFQIDPASLSIGFDCICVKIGNSGHATNYVSVMFWMLPRYPNKVSAMSATEYIVD